MSDNKVNFLSYFWNEISFAWRKVKRGGPVYPVNIMRGWMDKGEFDKTEYLKYQEQILNEK